MTINMNDYSNASVIYCLRSFLKVYYNLCVCFYNTDIFGFRRPFKKSPVYPQILCRFCDHYFSSIGNADFMNEW